MPVLSSENNRSAAAATRIYRWLASSRHDPRNNHPPIVRRYRFSIGWCDHATGFSVLPIQPAVFAGSSGRGCDGADS